VRTLEYNSDDKVTRVLDDGVEVIRYEYDGAGRRVAAYENGQRRNYLVTPNLGDGYETPQAVTSGDGAILEAYVFAGEHAITRFDATATPSYYLRDAMGSVIGMTDGSGALTSEVQWDAFGNVRESSGDALSGAAGGGFGLHGMWLDEATGLYHVRARTYDARTGRFVSRDPVIGIRQRPETHQPYALVSYSPTIFRDPTGRFGVLQIGASLSTQAVLAAGGEPGAGLLSSFRASLFGDPDEIDIVAYGVPGQGCNAGFTYCGYTHAASALNFSGHEIFAYDTHDLVGQVTTLAEGKKIRALRIVDHGDEDSINIGTDHLNISSLKGLDENQANFGALFGQLSGKFASEGFVHLQNCRIGQYPAFLLNLSEILGVPVYAGTGDEVWGAYNTGEIIRCDPGASECVQAGRP
jgi:RHS repeat-associated protein